MKVYIAAEQKELGIKLANMINRGGSTCIMSDEDSSDYKVLLSDIKGSIAGFNMAILVSKMPLDASIEANRMGGIRATVCKDLEDVLAAIKARANLIIFDSAKIYKMDTRAMLKSIQDSLEEPESASVLQERRVVSQGPAPKPAPAKAPGSGGGFFGSVKSIFGADGSAPEEKMPKMDPPKKKIMEKKPQKAEEEMPQKRRGKGGLFGSLKDTFGVE